jgi:hypothetical protein
MQVEALEAAPIAVLRQRQASDELDGGAAENVKRTPSRRTSPFTLCALRPVSPAHADQHNVQENELLYPSSQQ